MSDINIMSEILAPAGNAECAEAAINAGADAIYLGFRSFSARAGADNFDADALHTVLEKAHFLGVKVYVAMNTLVKDTETEEFIKTFLDVWNMGADAVILQDVLLGKYLHAEYPDVVLHLSTQAGVCTLDGARYAKECGFSRVILARETPLAEIEKIASFMETEVFVQGALCTCFSGQCYFSSFAGNNSGNRGRCKQPCRKLYSYDREGFEDPAYALSLSDLCIGEEIEKLRKAGVTSFKIEGRMRRAEYVSAAVRYYRGLLDGADEKERNEALSDLKRTYNRGNFTKGLAFGQDKRLSLPRGAGTYRRKGRHGKGFSWQIFCRKRFFGPKRGRFQNFAERQRGRRGRFRNIGKTGLLRFFPHTPFKRGRRFRHHGYRRQRKSFDKRKAPFRFRFARFYGGAKGGSGNRRRKNGVGRNAAKRQFFSLDANGTHGVFSQKRFPAFERFLFEDPFERKRIHRKIMP